MALHLAGKYSDTIASVFTNSSYVKGKTSEGFDFEGVKSIRVYTPSTVPMTDYQRSGTERYGAPTEMADSVQEMILGRDRAFSLTIDKGNNDEQMGIKNAGRMLKLQLEEQAIPEADRYALARFAECAGTVASIKKPTADTICRDIAAGLEVLDEHMAPPENRYLYLSSEMYSLLALSKEFLSNQMTGGKALSKGEVGEFMNAAVVKVPKAVMPKDCYFLITHKSAVVFPIKLSDSKIHQDPPGVSGALLEGRSIYDAFVLGARSGGVYAAVAEGKKLAEPQINCLDFGTEDLTMTASGGAYIKYTLDGSDPRYNGTVYSGPVSTKGMGSVVVKAVAMKDGSYPSGIREASYMA